MRGANKSNTAGNCTYALNAEIRAVVSGNNLTGQIDYTSATNGNPDCSTIGQCDSFQDLSGTRVTAVRLGGTRRAR